MTTQKYAAPHIANHWFTALLILGMLGSGFAYRFELAGKGALVVHQVMGQVLIVLLVLRIITRLSFKTQHTGPHHKVWERALAGFVHGLLYLCLIAFVVTGYVSASALTNSALLFPADLAFARSDTGELLLEAHYALKWVLIGLLIFHIAGAAKHAIFDRDGTLALMWFHQKKG